MHARPARLQEHVARAVQVLRIEQEQHGVTHTSLLETPLLHFLAGGKSESVDSWDRASVVHVDGESPAPSRRGGKCSWLVNWSRGVDSASVVAL